MLYFFGDLTAASQRDFKTNKSSKIHTLLANSQTLLWLCSEIQNLFTNWAKDLIEPEMDICMHLQCLIKNITLTRGTVSRLLGRFQTYGFRFGPLFFKYSFAKCEVLALLCISSNGNHHSDNQPLQFLHWLLLTVFQYALLYHNLLYHYKGFTVTVMHYKWHLYL